MAADGFLARRRQNKEFKNTMNVYIIRKTVLQTPDQRGARQNARGMNRKRAKNVCLFTTEKEVSSTTI